MREWAQRHGTATGPAWRANPIPAVVIGIALVALVGGFAVHASRVGVLTPWTPTVDTPPAACDLLAAVDLAQAWPAAAGQLKIGSSEGATGNYCGAHTDVSHDAPTPYYSVLLHQVTCYPGGWLASPVQTAITHLDIRRSDSDPSPGFHR